MKSETGNVPAAGAGLPASHWRLSGGLCSRSGRALLAAALMMALPGAALAAVNEFGAGMTASGTAPFVGACTQNGTAYTPGEDACEKDNVVRTHDSVYYQVGFSLTPQDTNARLVLEVPAATYPGTYTAGGTPRVGHFRVADIPGGPNGCQNISSAPLTEPVAAGVSGVTVDGKKLYCAQPSPISSNSLSFAMRIDGAAPNGTVQPAPKMTFSSDGNPSHSNPTPLTGQQAGIDLYGLGDVVVSAAPRWDAVKDQFRGALFVPGSGPNGEDGYVFSWAIGIKANGSIKGLEALGEAGWEDNYSDLAPGNGDPNANDFPNARLVTWPIVNAYANTNVTGNAANGNPRHCGDWFSRLHVRGNSFDNRFHFPNDRGNIELRGVDAVARGGECVMRPGSNDTGNRNVRFDLINTDFSLNHYPRRKGSNAAGQVLVDPLNPDASSNEYWVATKTVLVWAPLTDIELPPGTGTRTETLTNRIQFSGTSVTGQANVDPISDNDVRAQHATRSPDGGFSKIISVWEHNNPNNDLDTILQSDVFNQPGDAWVNQMSPNQYFSLRLSVSNTGTEAFANSYFCDKLDNNSLSFVDTTAPAFMPRRGGYTKDPATGIVYTYISGNAADMPLSFQLGVGGAGITDAPSAGGTAAAGSGTWTSMTLPDNEYTGPGRRPAHGSSGAMATATCGDGDARWFNSMADLLAAGYTAQDVSRVRANYPYSKPGVGILVYIPMKALEKTQWDISVSNLGEPYVAPGNTLPANTPTADRFTPNQALWRMTDTVVRRGTDSARIFQTEYAQIIKTSPSHPNDGAVTPGSLVTYNLQVNLTTTGSAHSTTAYVYDVLPQHLSYEAGSTTLGGTAFADPVCVPGPAPWPAGWGSPSIASADIPADFSACRWELLNQNVTKAAYGDPSANLPLLQFRARVAVAAPDTASLLNTSFADSTDNLFRDARYGGADVGFVCVPGEACSQSNWLLRVNASAASLVEKYVNRDRVSVDGAFDYVLEYGAVSTFKCNTLRFLS